LTQVTSESARSSFRGVIAGRQHCLPVGGPVAGKFAGANPLVYYHFALNDTQIRAATGRYDHARIDWRMNALAFCTTLPIRLGRVRARKSSNAFTSSGRNLISAAEMIPDT
jgi:hypothetical protein